MAAENKSLMSAQPPMQASHRGAPTPVMQQQSATSPPSRRELASWWKTFRKTTKKEEEKGKHNFSIVACFTFPSNGTSQYAEEDATISAIEGSATLFETCNSWRGGCSGSLVQRLVYSKIKHNPACVCGYTNDLLRYTTNVNVLPLRRPC